MKVDRDAEGIDVPVNDPGARMRAFAGERASMPGLTNLYSKYEPMP